jgi:hypothetical protein
LGSNALYITEEADEALNLLKLHMFDLIFLNRDGEKVAIYIEKFLSYEPEIIFHTIDQFIGKKLLSILPSAKLLEYNSEEFFEVGEQLWL